MALVRCPKCQGIISSDDETCKYCGYKLKKAAKSKVVAVPDKDSFNVDGQQFETVSNSNNFDKNDINIVSNDPSNSQCYKGPAVYSPNRIKELRWCYFAVLILTMLFMGLGVMFLFFAINELKTLGKTDIMLGMAVVSFAFGMPLFIYSLIRFIQSFKNPVLACALDEERRETRGEVIAEAIAETVVGVIGDIL